MRVLMLNYEFPPLGGGAANATFHILRKFTGSHLLEIDVVVSSVSSHKIEQFADNIRVHYIDIGKNDNLHHQSNTDLLKYSAKAYWYIKQLQRTINYDLVHAFFGIPCGFLAMFLNLPTLVSLRGSDVPGYNQRFKWLDIFVFSWLSKVIWSRAKFTIVNSEGLWNLAKKNSPKLPIYLIPNGVDVGFWKPSKHKKTGGAKLKIISVGRLIPRKGFVYLIKALKNLPVQLTLVGDGPDMNELKALAKEQKVNLKITGKLEQNSVKNALQTAELFVLPSFNEGMSNAVLEAMACALPIIMTNVGGAEELINDNGYIVNTGSSQALRKAILTYLNTEGLLEKHGNASLDIATKMSWENVASMYLSYYQKALRD